MISFHGVQMSVKRRVAWIALACVALGAGAAWQHVVSHETREAHVFVDEGLRALARGDRGRAVLALERADALAPRASFVRSSLQTSNVTDAFSPLAHAFHFVTSEEWLTIAGAGAWASGLSLALLVLRGRERKSSLPWVALGAGALSVLATLAVVATKASPRAVVLDAEVPVRIAPYSAASAESTLARGTVVVVGPEFAGFRRVETGNGAPGWVARSSIESISHPGA